MWLCHLKLHNKLAGHSFRCRTEQSPPNIYQMLAPRMNWINSLRCWTKLSPKFHMWSKSQLLWTVVFNPNCLCVHTVSNCRNLSDYLHLVWVFLCTQNVCIGQHYASDSRRYALLFCVKHCESKSCLTSILYVQHNEVVVLCCSAVTQLNGYELQGFKIEVCILLCACSITMPWVI